MEELLYEPHDPNANKTVRIPHEEWLARNELRKQRKQERKQKEALKKSSKNTNNKK